jgi:hypothetical protein
MVKAEATVPNDILDGCRRLKHGKKHPELMQLNQQLSRNLFITRNDTICE